MTTHDAFELDCRTCLAANTTACSECVVNHLLANDDGPIEFVPVEVQTPASQVEQTVALFQRAGLVGSEVTWVAPEEFDAAGGREPAASLSYSGSDGFGVR